MKIKELRVITPQGLAGDLRHKSQYEFDYQTNNPACAVSLALPLEKDSLRSNVLPPIFSMSLPEDYLLNKIHEKVERVPEPFFKRLLAEWEAGIGSISPTIVHVGAAPSSGTAAPGSP